MSQSLKAAYTNFTTYIQAQPLRLVVAILWSMFVCLVVKAGFTPNSFNLQRIDMPPPYPYPFALVATLIMVMLLHIALLFTVDSYMQSKWKTLIMLIITLPFTVSFMMAMMHPPPALVMTAVWFLLFLALLLLIVICQLLLWLLRTVLS